MKIVILSMFIGLIATLIAFNSSVHSIEQSFKSKIGTKCVINNDTLIVVDYSLFEDSFILSNGMKVSKELITKN